MQYSHFCRICANWSKTERCQDYSIPYPVVTYTDYADSIDKFIEKYPTFTVETTGRAISGSTFGEPCKNNFGTLTFETINFVYPNFYTVYLCQDHDYNGNYDVGVEIGLGCKNAENKLYLRPFINGWMYSAGAYSRCLDFGLSVTSITFNPKSQISVVIV